ncbi:MAG: PAS domain S-box protein [Methanospirillum sp.]|uniref:response regulator n=1 Tax=Methanospirillum sp. TaxID=45200 RepID=UPI00236BCCA6|nr:response regulator [Methanospirillum sp.]MDD1728057.1 PAS domain S-box protein [Methanospirillum sp.]
MNKPDTGSGNHQKITVLYVDDEPDLLSMGKAFLERLGEFSVDTLKSAHEALKSSTIQTYEVIVSDYQMPGMDGIAFLQEVRRICDNIPFILFTGRRREEVVIQAINNGADFYVQKGRDPIAQFAELGHKIRIAVEKNRIRQLLWDSDKRLSDIIGFFPDPTFAIDMSGSVTAWNRALEALTGLSTAEMLGKGKKEYSAAFYTDDRPLLIDLIDEPDEKILQYYLTFHRDGDSLIGETETIKLDGTPVFVQNKVCRLYTDAGEVTGAIESIREITQLKKTEGELRRSEERYRSIVNNLDEMIIRLTPDGIITFINEAFHRFSLQNLGLVPVEGMAIHEFLQDSYPRFVSFLAGLSRNEPVREMEQMIHNHTNAKFWLVWSVRALFDKSDAPDEYQVVVRDITERKQAEEVLQEEHARYRWFAENALDMLYRISLSDQRFEYLSPATTNLTGYTPEELYADPTLFQHVIHPDWQEYYHLQWSQALKGNIPPISEYKILDRCGNAHWCNQRNVVVYDDSGKPVALEGIVTDVTQQKEIEDTLRRSEKRFLAVTQNAGSWIWEIDPDGIYTYASPAVYAILGYWPDELVGKKHFYDLFDPDVREELKAVVMHAIKRYRVINDLVNCNLDRKGRHVYLKSNAVPVYDEQGAFTGYCGVDLDITSEKEAEGKLAASEEKYRSFVENANAIVFSLTPDGVFTYASPNWTELLGHDVSEVIGKPASLFTHPDDYAHNLAAFNHIINAGEKLRVEGYRVCHKNGSWQWHSQSLSPVFDATGTVVSIQGICHDVTERRQIEEALKKANRQLNLLTGITRHDILNKLSVILGSIGVAERKNSDPDLPECHKRIKSAAHAIQSQITFTRIYEDLGVKEPQWIDLDSIISEIVIPATITLHQDLKQVSVFADPMIEKVFFNLLDNSIRHGEKVTKIRLSANEDMGDLVVVWEDNGVGIPPDEKELIFERGYGKNTGLGMFLAREILDLTGISIYETGSPGTGARFEIRIPRGMYRIG